MEVLATWSGDIIKVVEAVGSFENMTITGYGEVKEGEEFSPTIPPQKLNIAAGATLRILVTFDYTGPSQTVSLYGAIGTKGIWGFDEVCAGQKSLSLPNSPSAPTSISDFTDIALSSEKISAGTDYDIYVKIGGKSETITELLDVINITGGGAFDFSSMMGMMMIMMMMGMIMPMMEGEEE